MKIRQGLFLAGILFTALCNAPLTAAGQKTTSKGIEFVQASTWEEVLTKARTERKMIFVDCFTTWCAPCKAMDMSVYPSQTVGAFFNDHFISVKVQMDQTAKDEPAIKSWYGQAKMIEKDYLIDAYPTFLFLSSDGKPLHRAAGAYSELRFISLGKDALDSNRQSYTLAAKYDLEKMDTSELRQVALNYKRSNPEFATQLAHVYFGRLSRLEIQNMILEEKNPMIFKFKSDSVVILAANEYFSMLPENEFFTNDALKKARYYALTSSKDKMFAVFYRNAARIDRIFNGSAEFPLDITAPYLVDIIYSEDVLSVLQHARDTHSEPPWAKIAASLTKKYNQDYSSRILILAKQAWAGTKQNKKEAFFYRSLYMDRYGLRQYSDFGLNSEAWDVFQNSSDSLELATALKWIDRAVMISPNPNWIDTYANLLYKLGKRESAIRWENVAIKLDPENKEFRETLEKIKAGVPTWPDVKKIN